MAAEELPRQNRSPAMICAAASRTMQGIGGPFCFINSAITQKGRLQVRISKIRNLPSASVLLAIESTNVMPEGRLAVGRADFGTGSESVCQVVTKVSYKVSYKVSDNRWLSFGHCQLNVDYHVGGTAVDVPAGGPPCGAT